MRKNASTMGSTPIKAAALVMMASKSFMLYVMLCSGFGEGGLGGFSLVARGWKRMNEWVGGPGFIEGVREEENYRATRRSGKNEGGLKRVCRALQGSGVGEQRNASERGWNVWERDR